MMIDATVAPKVGCISPCGTTVCNVNHINAGTQAPPIAAATEERSNCLGCQGCLVSFLVLDLLGLPGRPMLQHSIEHRQQLTHTRRQSDFFAFPCRKQPLIKSFDLRIKACRHECTHVQHSAPRRATAPNHPPTAESPTG